MRPSFLSLPTVKPAVPPAMSAVPTVMPGEGPASTLHVMAGEGRPSTTS